MDGWMLIYCIFVIFCNRLLLFTVYCPYGDCYRVLSLSLSLSQFDTQLRKVRIGDKENYMLHMLHWLNLSIPTEHLLKVSVSDLARFKKMIKSKEKKKCEKWGGAFLQLLHLHTCRQTKREKSKRNMWVRLSETLAWSQKKNAYLLLFKGI